MKMTKYITKCYTTISDLDRDLRTCGIPMRVGLAPTFTEIETFCPDFRTLGNMSSGGNIFTLDSDKINALLGEKVFPPQAIINGFVINLIIDRLLNKEIHDAVK